MHPHTPGHQDDAQLPVGDQRRAALLPTQLLHPLAMDPAVDADDWLAQLAATPWTQVQPYRS
ncbi:hypothetical protein CHLRE_03g179840v5 [Chlamydomonas reinhardtii]|uniref:Uncharacterized protein n=1 Tax=Chlamydomonas reinhardtii TaxID=3055 RepID=A0A2K3DXM6_CHLRE|nr:uncharacterized protein CHLRE_03g179840v5 [Chlamydomonas reinhardtii]PNW85293.1 hypothetical protein CHLRE_03g179840v5 [Chlamydomonas reinhardtii]